VDKFATGSFGINNLLEFSLELNGVQFWNFLNFLTPRYGRDSIIVLIGLAALICFALLGSCGYDGNATR
jgi:hypothetical protein